MLNRSKEYCRAGGLGASRIKIISFVRLSFADKHACFVHALADWRMRAYKPHARHTHATGLHGAGFGTPHFRTPWKPEAASLPATEAASWPAVRMPTARIPGGCHTGLREAKPSPRMRVLRMHAGRSRAAH